MSRPSIAIAAALGILLAPALARADGAEAEAERLFSQGKAHLEAGRVHEACQALAASQRLDPAEGTALALGLCHEREGALDAARAELAGVVASTQTSGREDRRRVAEAALARVEVRASAVEPRAAAEAPREADSTSSRATSVEPKDRDAEDRQADAERAPREKEPAAPFPWVPASVAGASVVALGAGAVFGLRAFSKWDDVATRCGATSACDDTARASADAASSAAVKANVLVGGGIVLGAVAAVLYFTKVGAPSRTGARARRLTLRATPQGVEGVF